MTKWELFTKVAKAIHEMVNPSEDEIYRVIEGYLDPVYCPTCGSCGETGCCSPDRCNEVICLYGASNLKDYKELLEENEALRNKVTKLEKNESNLKNIGWNLASDECCGCLGYMEVVTEIGTLEEKKLTWGELADTNTQEYDPSGYPKL